MPHEMIRLMPGLINTLSGLPDANTIISFRLVTIHFVATAGSFAHCSAFVFR